MLKNSVANFQSPLQSFENTIKKETIPPTSVPKRLSSRLVMASDAICQVAPSWLDREFMENMLIKSECDRSIRVQNVSGAPGPVNGANYMSDILRINVEFTRDLSGKTTTEHKSIIFKVQPDKESFLGILMLTDTVIKMTEALNEKGVRFGPRVYHAQTGDSTFIAMEDLAVLGFRMADRKSGLDLQHCKFAIKRMAKLHATSIALREKNSDVAKLYLTSFYNTAASGILKKIVNGALESLAFESAKWEELDPSYSIKLSKLTEVCYDKLLDYTAAKKDDFNVINHGDCWTNNMLFRYNEKGEIVDHIFIDFQLTTYGPPAVDLIYFLHTSACDDVMDHHYDEILKEYLKTLTSTMSRLGCEAKPPTWELLRKSLQERRFLEVVYSCMILPLVLVDDTEVVAIANLVNPKEGEIGGGYKSRHFRQKITKRLKEWNSLGLLDV